MGLKKTLSEWSFSEPQLPKLPLDKETCNSVRRNVPGALFSLVSPTPLKSPRLICASASVLKDILDMEPHIVDSQDFVEWVSGNRILPGSIPMAHRYGGHQFGYWAGQLGDGRAHLLGEYTNSKGERWELQLKGSGVTPYSRFGDGRAVLRSSIREFLCSEAMAALGVPTSRAAAIVLAEDKVPRDIFYNGRPRLEPCAVVLRLAPTWFRFGSLEILAISGELEELRQLADFLLVHTFPHIQETGEGGYLAMFQQVVTSTAELIAHWNTLGFAHGVLNTDNMSMASVTIDYGPFGFVDAYQPGFTPNHSDDMGRYDLQSQGNIGSWNLEKLATALKPLLSQENQRSLDMVMAGYEDTLTRHQHTLWRKKLGLEEEREGDTALVENLLDIMAVVGADFTQTFRDLSELRIEDLEVGEIPSTAWGLNQCFKHKEAGAFLKMYTDRVKKEKGTEEERRQRMGGRNPRYVLRNWMAQAAIEMAEKDDFSEVQFLHTLLQDPFTINREAEALGYSSPPPAWAARLAVSCSS